MSRQLRRSTHNIHTVCPCPGHRYCCGLDCLDSGLVFLLVCLPPGPCPGRRMSNDHDNDHYKSFSLEAPVPGQAPSASFCARVQVPGNIVVVVAEQGKHTISLEAPVPGQAKSNKSKAIQPPKPQNQPKRLIPRHTPTNGLKSPK